jgi:anti-sigma factor RsiW
MSHEPCDQIREHLVAYSDGELAGDALGRLEAHLAECPGCRSELDRLERSLDVARSVWQEAAEGAAAPAVRAARWRWAAALASAAAVMLVGLGTWAVFPSGRQAQTARHPPGEAREAPGRPGREKKGIRVDFPRLDDRDLAAAIAREGRAARLAASIAMLATEPSLEAYRVRAERYLAEVDPARGAGRKHEPAAGSSIKEPKS